RNEARSDALNLVRRVRAALERLRFDRHDGHDERVRIGLLQYLPDAADRASRADAGNDRVDLAAGVAKDLLRRRFAVDLRIGWIVELLRLPRVRVLLRVLARLRQRDAEAGRAGSEDQ